MDTLKTKLDEQVLEVLMHEFHERRNEIMFHIGIYHKQIAYSYIYVSIIATLGGIINALGTSQPNVPPVLQFMTDPVTRKFVSFSFIGISAVFYFFFLSSIMQALYMTYALGKRTCQIEEYINQKFKMNLTVWDSKLVERVLGIFPIIYKGWIRPHILQTIWTITLMLGMMIIISLFSLLLLPEYKFIPVILVLITFFHIYQHFKLLVIGPEYLEKAFVEFSPSTIIEKASANHFQTNHFQTTKEVKPVRISPIKASIATFVLGFAAYSTASLIDGTFLPSSNVAFPVTKIFTIVIGDSIFLPIIVGIYVRFLSVLRENLNAIKTEVSSYPKLTGWLLSKRVTIIGVLVAVLGNIYMHYIWIHDNYTGFMDTSMGKLTIAGWIHLIFSFLSGSMVIISLLNGIIADFLLLKAKGNISALLPAVPIFLRGTCVLLIFQSIQFFDLFYRTKYIFPSFGQIQNVWNVVFGDLQVYLSILPIFLILILTVVATRKLKRE